MTFKMTISKKARTAVSYVLLSLAAGSAWATGPTLTVGTASGAPGTSVSIPVTFNPSTFSVSDMQFNITVPSGLSTGAVTAGSIATAAGKQVQANLNGNTWTFVVFGINQNAIGSGTLLTAQLNILPGTAAGTLNLPVSAVVYSDPNGVSVPPGPSTNGSVTVTGTGPAAPVITSAGSASGTVGMAFSYNITASNSPTSYNATGLPAGLTVNTTSGLISGTPSASGTSSVTISATNAGGTGSATLTLTINASGPAAPVITSALTTAGMVGSAFSYQITASNSPTSFNATGLPAGLTINTTSGLISGTPSIAATTNVTISATNSGGTGSATLVLTVNPATPATPVITSALNASGTVGSAFSYQITASNSPTSFNATGLPAGLSINMGTGLISGTPTASGTSNVTISATNSSGTGTATLVLAISALGQPTLAGGSTSGSPGTTVNLPITFNPSTASVASLQFNVNLPAQLSTGAITPGAILTTAGKQVSANLSGNTWTFIVYGLNQNAISAGTLVTVQLTINAGTAGGNLSVPISGAVYSSPTGFSIPAGASTPGTITVVPTTNVPPTVSIISPSNGATVSGVVSIAGSATAGSSAISFVQFKLDGNNLGAPMTGTPYIYSWDTTGAAPGTHTLTLVAVDLAGNSGVSSPITVTVANSSGTNTTAGLNNVLAYPNPAVHQDPTIRAMVGVVNSVDITIFDLSGRVVNSTTLTGSPTGMTQSGAQYYDYKWTGSKPSGIYFAVIHAKPASGAEIKARVKFAFLN